MALRFRGSVDMDKVRSAVSDHQEAKSKYNSPDFEEITWLRWKEGTNNIRILPPWSKENIIARVVQTHYQLEPSNENFRCLRKTWGKQCYICTAYGRIWDISPDFKFRWRTKAYANVIDRDDMGAGVQVASLPMSVYNYVTQMMLDPDIGDITLAEFGTDIKVTKQITGNRPQDVKYTTSFWNQNTPIADTVEEMQELIDACVDLDKVFRKPTQKHYQENLKASGELLKEHKLHPINPDNLMETDQYVIESKFPTGQRQASPSPQQQQSQNDGVNTQGHPDCFGQYAKDAENCEVCGDAPDCMDNISASGDSDTIPWE